MFAYAANSLHVVYGVAYQRPNCLAVLRTVLLLDRLVDVVESALSLFRRLRLMSTSLQRLLCLLDGLKFAEVTFLDGVILFTD